MPFREKSGVHLLTIKCFRPYERNVKSGLKAYDSNVSRLFILAIKNTYDFRCNHQTPVSPNLNFDLRLQQMDEMQVKVVVRDIDDNSPVFLQHNTTTGVRVNAPLYTVIETLTAVDADVDSSAVFYQVGFLSLRGFSSNCHIYWHF